MRAFFEIYIHSCARTRLYACGGMSACCTVRACVHACGAMSACCTVRACVYACGGMSACCTVRACVRACGGMSACCTVRACVLAGVDNESYTHGHSAGAGRPAMAVPLPLRAGRVRPDAALPHHRKPRYIGLHRSVLFTAFALCTL